MAIAVVLILTLWSCSPAPRTLDIRAVNAELETLAGEQERQKREESLQRLLPLVWGELRKDGSVGTIR